MTEHGLDRDITFSPEQDVTADDLNELVRRLLVLETLIKPARVIDSEHARTTVSDYLKEGAYLLLRAIPWLLVIGTLAARLATGEGELVSHGWLWGTWGIITLVGLSVIFVVLRNQYTDAPPRWEIRELVGNKLLVFKRGGGLSGEIAFEAAESRESWLGTLFGVRWVRHPAFRSALRCVNGPTGVPVVTDRHRTLTEIADLAALVVGLLLAIARTIVPSVTHALGPDRVFLVLLAATMLITLVAGRAIAQIVATPDNVGGAR